MRFSQLASRESGRAENSTTKTHNAITLSAVDILAPTTMKNAAKCDTSRELQNLVNHQNFERTCLFRDIPGRMFVGVSVNIPHTNHPLVVVLESEPSCLLGKVGPNVDVGVEFVSPMRLGLTKESSLGGNLETKLKVRETFLTTQKHSNRNITFGPPIKQEDPLNLSI